MDFCLNCKGAIFPPNVPYSYGGPICHCPVNPQHIYQRPASKEKQTSGIAAWMPAKEETEDFYKCHCGDPKWPTCYWPGHRLDKQDARLMNLKNPHLAMISDKDDRS